MGVGLFVGIWVARYLGPEKYGMLNYALALVSIFSPLAALGLEDIVVRDIVRQPACKEETLGTAFVLKLTGSLVAFVAVMTTVLFLRPTDSFSHWLVGIVAAGSILQVFNITECWFNSQIQAKYIVFAKNTAFIICAVLKIALIIAGASLTAFAVIFTVEVGIGSLGLIVVYKFKGGSFNKWRVSLKRAKTLLRDSWPLFFSIISIVIYQRIDQVMLQEMVGSEEVGIYSVAVTLVAALYFIPSAIYWSFFPGILHAKQVSEQHFYDQLQKFYNLMALLSYGIAIPTTLLAPWLIPALYGEAYSRAGLMLIVLVWANIFTSLEIARTAFLNAMDLNRMYFVMVTAGGVINLLLNIVLIPRYGGVGAAIASLVAYWFAAHGSCFLFRSMHKTGFMLSKALTFPKIW
jgi:O-antigen/teichoic acid export membrane protein